MEITLDSVRQLTTCITSAYIAKVQDEEGYGLYELATTPSYGFSLELSLSGDGTWSFDDTSIKFEETAGSSSRPDAGDLSSGIAGYMPETALVKPDDPLHKIDALVKLWGVSLPPMREHEELGDQDRWRQFERFKSLVAGKKDLKGRVQAALLNRVDDDFCDELHESVRRWLSQGYGNLVACLTAE